MKKFVLLLLSDKKNATPNLETFKLKAFSGSCHYTVAMSRVPKWKIEKTKVKVVFRLQFHATNVSSHTLIVLFLLLLVVRKKFSFSKLYFLCY